MAAVIYPVHATAVHADSPLDRLITRVAVQENLDPDLLRAVVATESDFNNETVSPDGAVGLMQLMPETARILGVKNIHNPEQNLRGGARYLNQMLKKFPKIPHALAAYNAGPKMVERFEGIPPLTETQRYVGKVMSYYKKSAGSKKRFNLGKKFVNRENSDPRSAHDKSSRMSAKVIPPIPTLSIRRTHTLARHDLIAPTPHGKRVPQFALALSAPVQGESVPILRAAQ
ncbi:MAG: lytic transglycosylase domain-containing protein [Magnetococcales bacterium]|nr:lytic transglycosylase domain-containing protein [Magnetococcales bacterium]NGZ05593.1 lytic transglycosylase domain-containing protein [Magnetococcales bacterium]